MAAEYLSKCTSHFITQSERCVPDFLTLIYPLAASDVATSGAPVKIKWNKTKFFKVKVRSGETRIVRSADRLTTFSAIWSEMFIKFWILTLLSALRADWISSLVTWRWFMAHTNRNLCNWFFFLKIDSIGPTTAADCHAIIVFAIWAAIVFCRAGDCKSISSDFTGQYSGNCRTALSFHRMFIFRKLKNPTASRESG